VADGSKLDFAQSIRRGIRMSTSPAGLDARDREGIAGTGHARHRRRRGTAWRSTGVLVAAVLFATAIGFQAQGQTTGTDIESRARALGARRAWPELAQLAAQWVQSQPNAPAAWLALGLADTGLERFDRALPELQRATTLGPELYWAWADLAMVDFSLSHYPQAINDYQRALQLKLGDVRALMGIGFGYVGLGDGQEASAFFDRAVKAEPTYQPGWYFLGLQQLTLGQTSQAIQTLGKATELNPKDVKSWFLLGRAYYQTGQAREVSRVFEQVLALDAAYAASYSDKFLNPTLDRWRPPVAGTALSPVAKAGLLEARAAAGQADAVQFLGKTAVRGEPAAANAAGVYDRDVRHDPAHAATWFNAAARQGNVDAAVALGRLYLTGQGVPENDATAYAWFEWAAWAGNAEAASLVADAYVEGRGGLPQDAEKAKFWQARAAAAPTPFDGLDDAPLSTFDRALGADAKDIVTSMLYVGGLAGDPTAHTGQLLAMVTKGGFARLDDDDILTAMRLRASLAAKANGNACAALWSGAEAPAVMEAVRALSPGEQTAWATLIATAARAAQSNRPAIAVTEAQLDAATRRLLGGMSRAERAAIDSGAAGTPEAQCGAARAFYEALERLDRADAVVIMRASVFG
jgi:tetratricopeptide (TPR) repeat protein